MTDTQDNTADSASAGEQYVAAPSLSAVDDSDYETNAFAIELDWDPAPSAAGYQLQSHAGDADWGAAIDLPSTDTSYEVSDLTDGTDYSFRIRAVNAVGSDSGYSSADAAISLAAPSDVTATANADAGQIALSWTNNSPDATGVLVLRSDGDGNWTQLAALTDADQWTDTASPVNTPLYYAVCATKGGPVTSDYAYSDAAVILAAPTVLVGKEGPTTEIDLTWTNNSLYATGFDVYRSTDQNTWPHLATVNQERYADTDIQAGTQYYYRVKAVDPSFGASSAATSAGIWTRPDTPCLSARDTSNPSSGTYQVALTWTLVPGASSYAIERSVDGVNWGSVGSSNGSTTTATIACDPSTAYSFRIRAVNAAGPSDGYGTAAATTAAEPQPNLSNQDGADSGWNVPFVVMMPVSRVSMTEVDIVYWVYSEPSMTSVSLSRYDGQDAVSGLPRPYQTDPVTNCFIEDVSDPSSLAWTRGITGQGQLSGLCLYTGVFSNVMAFEYKDTDAPVGQYYNYVLSGTYNALSNGQYGTNYPSGTYGGLDEQPGAPFWGFSLECGPGGVSVVTEYTAPGPETLNAISAPPAVVTGQTVKIPISYTDGGPAQGQHNLTINWGDGSQNTVSPQETYGWECSSSDSLVLGAGGMNGSATATHSYSTPGDYTVTVTLSDTDTSRQQEVSATIAAVGTVVNSTDDTEDFGPNFDGTPWAGGFVDSKPKVTLRSLLDYADATGNPLDVTFNIPRGGNATINASSPLPTITDKVNIRGVNIQGGGTITLNGSGLTFSGAGADGSSISGLAITNPGQVGIAFVNADSVTLQDLTVIGYTETGISLVASDSATVHKVSLTGSATPDANGQVGLLLHNSADGTFSDLEISNNASAGIDLEGSLATANTFAQNSITNPPPGGQGGDDEATPAYLTATMYTPGPSETPTPNMQMEEQCAAAPVIATQSDNDTTPSSGPTTNTSPSPVDAQLEVMQSLRGSMATNRAYGFYEATGMRGLLYKLQGALCHIGSFRYLAPTVTNPRGTYDDGVISIHQGTTAATVCHELVHAYNDQSARPLSLSDDEGMAYTVQHFVDTVADRFRSFEDTLKIDLATSSASARENLTNAWNCPWGILASMVRPGNVIKEVNNTPEALTQQDILSVKKYLGCQFGAKALADYYNQLTAVKSSTYLFSSDPTHQPQWTARQ